MIKAILKKPLDGNPEGSTIEYSKADFEMLERLGAVARAPDEAEDGKPPEGSEASDGKAQEPVNNKMAPAVSNKAAAKATDKSA